jgi:hypothetical protein
VAAADRGEAAPLGVPLTIAMGVPNPRMRAARCQIAAECALAVDDLGTAMTAVRTAVRAGLVDQQWMRACPLLGPLEADPEWAALDAIVSARAQAVRAALLR